MEINKKTNFPLINQFKVQIKKLNMQGIIIKVIKLLVIIYIKMNKDMILLNLTDMQFNGLIFLVLSMCSVAGIIVIKELTEEHIKMDELTTEAWNKYKSIKNMNQAIDIDSIKLIDAKKDYESKYNYNVKVFSLDVFWIILEGLLFFGTYLSHEDYRQSVETYNKWLKAKSEKTEDGLQ